jgi:hypothetical protein
MADIQQTSTAASADKGMGFTEIYQKETEEYFMSDRPPVEHPPFRLNDLPRELRDNIFDHALIEDTTFSLTEKETKDQEAEHVEIAERDTDTPMPDADPLDEALSLPPLAVPTLHASMRFHADVNILLANKQMKEEYEKRAKPTMELVLKDHQDYSFQQVTLPAHAKEVRTLEIHLILFCHNCPISAHTGEDSCHAAMELRNHRSWIEKLLPQMEQLRNLSIFAHICHDTFKLGDKLKLPCEAIVKTKVKDVLMWKGMKRFVIYRYDFSPRQDLEGPKEMIYEWEDGKEKEVVKKVEKTKAEEDHDADDEDSEDEALVKATDATDATDAMDAS